MVELKPCPFCGGKAEIIGGISERSSAQVRCTQCSCSTSYCHINMAIDKWNRRADNGAN